MRFLHLFLILEMIDAEFMQYLLQHNCQKKLYSELTTQILGIYTRDLGNIYCMAHFTSSGALFSSEVPNIILVNLSTSLI